MPGKAVKDFILPSTCGGSFRLSEQRGIERSTFVLDGEGAIARAWRGVKVLGHPQEVRDLAKTL